MKSTNKVLANDIQIISNKGSYMQLLLQLEKTMLDYGKSHPMIKNEYWWFAEQCGYKAKNYYYHLFKKRLHYKLSVLDIKKVYEITKDEQLKTTWNNYLGAN